MKVLIFSDTIWPEGSGGHLATYLYASLLREEDIDVTVIAWRLQGEYRYPFKVIKVNNIGFGKYAFLFTNKIEKLLKESNIIYLTPEPLTLVPFMKKLGKPVVVHIHSYYPVCPIGHLYNFLHGQICNLSLRSCMECIWIYESMRRSYTYTIASTLLNAKLGRIFAKHLHHADAVIFVSNKQKKLFLENIKETFDSRSYVIYNPIPSLKPLTMEEDGVGFFGGLDPIKGFSYLYEAWKNIYLKYPSNKKLHVALASQLPSKIERMGIIRHGRLSGSYYENVYMKIKTVAFPSISPEPSPYVVTEACLRGRMLIASNIGGVQEITEGLKGIILVKPKDTKELTEAIDWALSLDRSEILELGLKNREGILKKFNNSKLVKELIRIFEKC